MDDDGLHPEPEPTEPDNEHEIDEEGNILNISQSSQSSPDASDPAGDIHPTGGLYYSAGC